MRRATDDFENEFCDEDCFNECVDELILNSKNTLGEYNSFELCGCKVSYKYNSILPEEKNAQDEHALNILRDIASIARNNRKKKKKPLPSLPSES